MSFLSRRNSRPDRRGGRADAGRRAETDYDDYGYDYAPDDYRNDDNWSPDEYFSPEGIKGRWPLAPSRETVPAARDAMQMAAATPNPAPATTTTAPSGAKTRE